MTPHPWSPSALKEFKTCPRQYHAVRVIKSVKQTFSEDSDWGLRVHKAFENRQAQRTPLPAEMSIHEPFMERLERKPGHFFTEQKIGFDKKLRTCNFFDREVWCRAVIDYKKVDMEAEVPIALIVDYKTGKKREEFDQLMLYALHTFAAHPVNVVDVMFYWAIDQTTTRKVYGRGEIRQLWAHFVPDLTQFAQAFQTDVWQPRQSGLCNGWCPNTACEFWREKRSKS